jgi:hypothetical protein
MRSGRLGGWLAAGAIIAATGVLAWAFWPSNPATAPPRARHYLNVSACLLTDSRGIASGAPGARAWAAMQKASLATRVMVSYLPDTGTADAPVMLNTLVQRHCGVIITAGTAAGQVLGVAKANPRQQFLFIANPRAAGMATTPNVVIVTAADAPGRIDQVIHTLAPAA